VWFLAAFLKSEEVTGSYQLMQQQLKQTKEMVSPLLEQLCPSQMTKSQLCIVLLLASNLLMHFIKVINRMSIYVISKELV